MNLDNAKNGNGNKANCSTTKQQRIEDAAKCMTQVLDIFQPLTKSNFFKVTFRTTNLPVPAYIVVINDILGAKLALSNLAGVSAAIPAIGKDADYLALWNTLHGALAGGSMINYMKIQTNDTDVFAVNPVLFSINPDHAQKYEEIDLQTYVNEYSFRDLILSVPIKFYMNGNVSFLWDLTSLPVDTQVTIKFSTSKEIGRIYNI